MPRIHGTLMVAGLMACRWDAADPPLEQQCTPSTGPNQCWQWVPGGDALLGAQSTDEEAPGFDAMAVEGEGPVQRVPVEGFWMQRAEVSVRTYALCVLDSACSADHAELGDWLSFMAGPHGRSRSAPGLDLPIGGVTHQGAREVCRYVKGRLPTEAEWEWAARGPSGRRFPWGEDPRCTIADTTIATPRGDLLATSNCTTSGPEVSTRVAHPSPHGLRALAGNMWEWTADAWSPVRGGSAQAEMWVQKGGGWTQPDPMQHRSAVRTGMPGDVRLPDVGVRCRWGR